MRRSSSLALLPCVALAACTIGRTAPPGARVPVAGTTATVESEIPPATPEPFVPPASDPGPRPRVSVTHAENVEPANAARRVGAVANLLRGCPNAAGMPLRFRIWSDGSRTRINLVDAPGRLSAEQRRCVLDVMSNVDAENLGAQASPSNRPTNFTADFVISW